MLLSSLESLPPRDHQGDQQELPPRDHHLDQLAGVGRSVDTMDSSIGSLPPRDADDTDDEMQLSADWIDSHGMASDTSFDDGIGVRCNKISTIESFGRLSECRPAVVHAGEAGR